MTGEKSGKLGVVVAVVSLVVLAGFAKACGPESQTAAGVVAAAPAVATPSYVVPAVLRRQATVAKVNSPADVSFTDGSTVHFDMVASAGETDNPCQRKVMLAAAKKLLGGKQVTVVNDPTRIATEVTLPDGRDYEIALSTDTFQQSSDCIPDRTTTSSSLDVDVDVDHHGNLPDGALTGGYCRKKWWC